MTAGEVVLQRLLSLVDDDESVRESLSAFLKSYDFKVQTYSSAEEFLVAHGLRPTECLILDVTMPGMSGPDLQRELTRLGHDVPIVFMTACPDDNLRAKLLGRGAVAYLTKPLSETAILEAINAAFEGK